MVRFWWLCGLILISMEVSASESGVSKVTLAPKIEPQTDGRVHWISFRAGRVGSQPIKKCLLQHGYGITPQALSVLTQQNKRDGIFPRLREVAAKFISPKETFAYLYFGKHFIDRLLASSCEEVVVAIQESNQTSILEFTERTELFLKEKICLNQSRPNETTSCALVGHSMGGAVAFNIARRCMQGTSRLEETGCRALRKIYSATGIIQGAGATALIYGAKINRDRGDDIAIATLESLMGKLARSVTSGIVTGASLIWDLASDKTDNTNPTWFSLSPLAPMEEDRPLYLVNDVALKKEQWLVADFAASATKYRFQGIDSSESLGCGTRLLPKSVLSDNYLTQEAQNLFCEEFGKILGVIHNTELMSDSFKLGAREFHRIALEHNHLKEDEKNTRFLDDAFSWEKYQVSDGFADYHLALQSCQKGLQTENSAVKKCTTLTGINHQGSAGGALEAAKDIIDHLNSR